MSCKQPIFLNSNNIVYLKKGNLKEGLISFVWFPLFCSKRFFVRAFTDAWSDIIVKEDVIVEDARSEKENEQHESKEI